MSTYLFTFNLYLYDLSTGDEKLAGTFEKYCNTITQARAEAIWILRSPRISACPWYVDVFKREPGQINRNYIGQVSTKVNVKSTSMPSTFYWTTFYGKKTKILRNGTLAD